MAKIINFPNKQNDITIFLNNLIMMSENGEIDKISVIIKPNNPTENNYIMAGYFNCDVCDKQEMLSHMQVDIMMDVMKSNIGDLVEYVE